MSDLVDKCREADIGFDKAMMSPNGNYFCPLLLAGEKSKCPYVSENQAWFEQGGLTHLKPYCLKRYMLGKGA